MAETMRAALEAVPKGQMEAGYCIGESYMQIMMRIILPQALRTAFPSLSNSFIALIKETSMASTITVVEMFRQAQIINGRVYEPFALYVEAAVSMREAFGTLKFVNLGSGMGIPFCETDKPFDTTALGAETQRLMAEFQEKLPETRFYIETGRYAVGTAGTYVAKVVDKKVTHGKNFVLLSATLNGFARPSMVAMLEHFMGNGPIAAWEPIYTGDHSFQMIPLVETAERETVTVTGNLCTGTDLVLSDADMPKMDVGDTVVFPNAGSYAAVISPMQFASQPKPAQLFLRADGTVVNTDF